MPPASSPETIHRLSSWSKWSLFLLVLLWLVAWGAIVCLVPVQPRLVINADHESLMGFSPDGTTLVTAIDADPHLSSSTYHLWNTRTGQDMGTIGQGDRNILPNVVYCSQRNLIRELAFDFDSKHGFTLYDLITRKEAGSVNLGNDVDAEISALCFSRDGQTLSCCVRSLNKTRLRVIDVATGRVRVDLEGGRFEEFVLSQDGSIVATTRTIAKTNENIPDEQKLIILDTASGKTRTISENRGEEAAHLAISPDGTMLAACCLMAKVGSVKTRKVRVWDIETGKQIASFRGRRFPEFLPDGRGLTVWEDDVAFCDLATQKEVAVSAILGSPPIPIPGSRPLVVMTTRHNSEPGLLWQWCATYLGMKKLGEEIVGEEVAILDAQTGHKVASIIRPTRNVGVQVFPDGKMLALWTCENDESRVEIWDIPPRKPLRWLLALLAIPSVMTVFTLWKCWKAHSKLSSLRPA
jgi:WD40 repeat protein